MNQKTCLHDTLIRVASTDEHLAFTEYWECSECGETPSVNAHVTILQLQEQIRQEIDRLKKELE